jgi:hypothetical protein
LTSEVARHPHTARSRQVLTCEHRVRRITGDADLARADFDAVGPHSHARATAPIYALIRLLATHVRRV